MCFWKFLLIGILPAAFLLTGFVPIKESPIQSELSVEVFDEMLQISGTVINHSNQRKELNYQLDLKRSGQSGTSNTSQSGSLQIEAREDSGISTTRINAGKGDTCSISLEVTDSKGNLVSTSNVKMTIKG